MSKGFWDIKKGINIVDVLLTVLVLVFVLFKLNFLNLALYWDEAWVYAPAVWSMLESGPSLMPDAIDTELSRGHPLFFHFIATCWASVFGASIYSLHSFALTVSVILIVLSYFVASKLFSKDVGLGVALFLVLSEKFLAQSGILLPEVTLAVCILGAFYCYLSRKVLGYILFGAMALFTKESALVLIVAVLIWHILELILKRKEIQKQDWIWSFVVLSPLLFIGAFFMYQHHLFGWYFFPEHTNMMSFDLNEIKAKFILCYNDVFEMQGLRYSALFVGIVMPLLMTFGTLKRWQGIATVLLLAVAVKVLYGRLPVPDPYKIIPALIAFGLALFTYLTPIFKLDNKVGRTLCLSYLFILGFMLFSSFNFFTNRYLVCLIPIAAIGVLGLIQFGLRRYSKWLFRGLVAVFATILYVNIADHDRTGDCELGYSDAIDVHQAIADYCLANKMQQDSIYVSFMDQRYLSDPRSGYIGEGEWMGALSNKFRAGMTHAIFTSDIPDGEKETLGARGFVLLERFGTGKVSGEIYVKEGYDK